MLIDKDTLSGKNYKTICNQPFRKTKPVFNGFYMVFHFLNFALRRFQFPLVSLPCWPFIVPVVLNDLAFVVFDQSPGIPRTPDLACSVFFAKEQQYRITVLVGLEAEVV